MVPSEAPRRNDHRAHATFTARQPVVVILSVGKGQCTAGRPALLGLPGLQGTHLVLQGVELCRVGVEAVDLIGGEIKS